MVTYVTRDNILNVIGKLGKKTFWVPILSDPNLHYTQNRISSLYVYSFDLNEEFFIGINSWELDNIDIDYLISVIPPGNRIVFNAKYLSPYFIECVDADMLIWYFNNRSIEISNDVQKIFNIYRARYPDIRNINDVIPVMRILEYCRELKNQFTMYYQNPEGEDGYYFYENVYRKNMLELERAGIAIDSDRFRELFNRSAGDLMYVEYNPYTATGRPGSSTWNGVNLNSLNKSDESRSFIVSRFENGRLIEFDYDSYHLRLIGDIVGYKLPEGNIHEYFAKLYFKVDVVTPQLYNKSKKITFSQLYGGILPEYKDVEFFCKIEEFASSVWDNYQKNGYFSSPLSQRKFYKSWFDEMSKFKIFNYIIQCVETELNMMVLDKILRYLYHINSKIVLYTYDAILLDYDPSDGTEVLKDIKSFMSSFGYPVNTKIGINYHDMMEVNINDRG